MTNEVTRRDAIKFVAVLTVGTGATTADVALGQQADTPAETADAKVKRDEFLLHAKQYPENLMLSEPELLVLKADGRGYDLFITSARDEEGRLAEVGIRSRCVRIFRADPTVDEFTRQGGVYWRIRDMPGKVMLKDNSGFDHLPSGLIVMAVRNEQTIRLYTMTIDLRC